MQEKELFIKALRFLVDPDGSTGKEIVTQIQAGALRPDYFSDFTVKENKFSPSKFTLLFEFCLDYFNKYNELITDNILRNEIIGDKELGPHEQKDFIGIVKEICLEDYRPTEFPHIRLQIEKEYANNYSIYIYKTALNLSDDSDDPLGALDYVQKNITDLKARLNPNRTKLDTTQWLWQLGEQKLKQLDETGLSMIASCQFGFPSWDKMFGGLFPEELTVFAGPKNSFKSGLQNRIVIHNIFAGKKVVWATRENSITQNWNRLISFMTGIPLSKINTNSLEEGESKYFREAIEYLVSLKDNRVLIVPPNDCQTILMLKNYIQLNFGNEAPDLIAIDHIGRLKPSGTSYGQTWEKVLAVTEETKDMLSYFGSPGITPAHLNRGGHKDDSNELNHMQFDSISQIADNILMCKPDSDKPWKPPEPGEYQGEPGVLNCSVVRARNHPKNFVLQLEVEPSVGMAEEYVGSTYNAPAEVVEAIAVAKKEYRQRKLGKQ